ncbi:hypothetical protein [Parasitella parasitica]|uniref:GATA-type domain-containing protein n=1 Tax=Parasitella parasitica TaxID=35722 RepID=A0A0B7NEB1_9FUNG|nr:hypothetical protein [Parasitella parasitica]
MAPIVLKIKGDVQSSLFNDDDPSADLSKTWRVCTKVKDSLENGSRLENLSWRLWFAHNTNDNKNSTSVSPAAASLLRNFKVPDDFDFKALQQKKKKTHAELEADYRRKLSLQQKQQAEQKIQDFGSYKNAINADKQKEFTLHQFTSDQAGDQVIELEDIFNSFSGDMQAYLNPSEESPTSQQLDQIINQSWPLASADFVPSASNNPSPVAYLPPPYQHDYSDYNYNNESSSALYVSSEAMPPIPIGTLHNKLFTTLPKETLATAGRLLNNNCNTVNMPSSNYSPSVVQSTPNTPYMTPTLSFSTSQNNPAMAHQQMIQPQQHQFFVPPIATTTAPNNIIPTTSSSTSFIFSHHQPPLQQHQFHHHRHQQSKSLPPSRAPSPPPCDIGGSSSSASSSPTSAMSPSSSPSRRSMAISSSPSEGKAPVCSNCSTTSTPLWRRSANDELLCNACGLYLKLHNAPRPKYLKPQSSRKDLRNEDENVVQPLCSNCGTSTTPLWRRDLDGAPLCNACGLYLKLHHEKRPLSMKTDNIKKRQRCDNGNSTGGKSSSSTNNTLSSANKKKNRVMEEPLTTTVTFDTKYQYMDDIIPTNNNTSNDNNTTTNYSPFGSFGLTLTHQPI